MPKLRTCPAMLLVAFLFCTVIGSLAQTAVFTSLASFAGINGANPESSLTQGTDGNFYGTTLGGGSTSCFLGSCGTIFKITAAGALSTLYSFCAQTGCPDGFYVPAGLVQATDGNFYGTTAYGGTPATNCVYHGCGTIFKITPGGALTTLYSFCSQANCTDGDVPVAPLVQGSDGNLYGTTQLGGAYDSGTVFKITLTGTLTTLYRFCSLGFACPDGSEPIAGLVQATDGNFYGTTLGGGTYGYGTVFKITPSGTLTTLHSFDGSDGMSPYGGLVQATDGNFYGTTYAGGGRGRGTAFEVTPAGVLTTLYSFCSVGLCSDGEFPEAGLVQASDGNFYGTTEFGGNYSDCGDGCGTIFKLTSSGTLTTLHKFKGPDGGNPIGGLVRATNGTLYGTTVDGGTYGSGTVFRLAVVRPCATCLP
jgi:uncharacterized repeat protein (TIGR03803 family)